MAIIPYLHWDEILLDVLFSKGLYISSNYSKKYFNSQEKCSQSTLLLCIPHTCTRTYHERSSSGSLSLAQGARKFAPALLSASRLVLRASGGARRRRRRKRVERKAISSRVCCYCYLCVYILVRYRACGVGDFFLILVSLNDA